jgi:hypothetical protein
MSDLELMSVLKLRKVAAPAALVRAVERDGVGLLAEAQVERRRRRSWSVTAVNAGLTVYCIGQLLMCARTIGLLP